MTPTGESDLGQVTSWQNASAGRVAAPLRDRVVGMVRDAILTFELRPGQRLVERELIEQLSVSRTTIREVLGQLSAEGLVTMIPQRGAIVTIPTHDDAADLYEIRAALEPLAVRWFCERGTEADRQNLVKAMEEFARAGSGDDPVDALRAKDGIYTVLIEGARSQALQQQLTRVQFRVRAMRATSLAKPGRISEAVSELRAIVDAILTDHVDEAARLCALHVRTAGRIGLSRLDEINAISRD